MPFGLMVELHVESGISGIEAACHTVGHLGAFLIEIFVGHHQLVDLAERKHGAEPERGCRMGVYKCVAYEKAVFMGNENFLLGENHTADAVGGAGHAFTVELTDVLVSVGAVNSALIAVQTEIERSPVLDYRNVH